MYFIFREKNDEIYKLSKSLETIEKESASIGITIIKKIKQAALNFSELFNEFKTVQDYFKDSQISIHGILASYY